MVAARVRCIYAIRCTMYIHVPVMSCMLGLLILCSIIILRHICSISLLLACCSSACVNISFIPTCAVCVCVFRRHIILHICVLRCGAHATRGIANNYPHVHRQFCVLCLCCGCGLYILYTTSGRGCVALTDIFCVSFI